jgi:hypothetical protein
MSTEENKKINSTDFSNHNHLAGDPPGGRASEKSDDNYYDDEKIRKPKGKKILKLRKNSY